MRGLNALIICSSVVVVMLALLCIVSVGLRAIGAPAGAFIASSACAAFVLALSIVAVLRKG